MANQQRKQVHNKRKYSLITSARRRGAQWNDTSCMTPLAFSTLYSSLVIAKLRVYRLMTRARRNRNLTVSVINEFRQFWTPREREIKYISHYHYYLYILNKKARDSCDHVMPPVSFQ